ncbi:helix-turn-helix domain-containing protein [Parapusillimonas sp. SGNA-6]|jgi:cytoskeletal protein RodZ|nr:helix-turn-helix domain-containing protein [Parapusillimonas sp. SGNA-6]
MTQPLLKEEAQLDTVTPISAPSGLGPTLRSLREARGLSPSEVSSRLKFSSRQLEALETEQWDRLPSGVSLRGFVKNYGRYLEADVDALMVMLENQVASTRSKTVPVASATSLGPADLPLQAEPVHRPWGWLLIILILLFVAGFYAIERGWVPDSWLVFDWLKSLKK